MKETVPVAILGAGLSGLSCAFYLKKKCVVFEKDSRIGGLCKTEKVKGFTFDYTGHLLHFRKNENKKTVKALLKENLLSHQRRAWIFSQGTYTRYPFQANLYGLPQTMVKECVEGVRRARSAELSLIGKVRPGAGNFKKWIYANFGEGLARYFMIPYNEKFWTFPLEEMSTEWTEKFIPLPALKDVIAGAEGKQKRHFGYNSLFYYPLRGGIEVLPRSFVSSPVKIKLKSRAVKILLRSKKVKFSNGSEQRYDKLVSTLPLPELVRIIAPLPAEVRKASRLLRYVSVFNFNLGIDRRDISDKHWIYFPGKNFIFYRAGFYSNFSSFLIPPGASSIYTEVSYSKNKPLDKKRVAKRIIRDLIKAGIITSSDKILARCALDIKYAYPLYDHNRLNSLKVIQEFLRDNDVYSIGRFGSWEYLSMEDVISQARKIASGL